METAQNLIVSVETSENQRIKIATHPCGCLFFLFIKYHYCVTNRIEIENVKTNT